MVHVLNFDTEHYFYENSWSEADIQRQYDWIQADLIKANQNREKVPWLVVQGHRFILKIQRKLFEYFVVIGRCTTKTLGLKTAHPWESENMALRKFLRMRKTRVQNFDQKLIISLKLFDLICTQFDIKLLRYLNLRSQNKLISWFGHIFITTAGHSPFSTILTSINH